MTEYIFTSVIYEIAKYLPHTCHLRSLSRNVKGILESMDKTTLSYLQKKYKGYRSFNGIAGEIIRTDNIDDMRMISLLGYLRWNWDRLSMLLRSKSMAILIYPRLSPGMREIIAYTYSFWSPKRSLSLKEIKNIINEPNLMIRHIQDGNIDTVIQVSNRLLTAYNMSHIIDLRHMYIAHVLVPLEDKPIPKYMLHFLLNNKSPIINLFTFIDNNISCMNTHYEHLRKKSKFYISGPLQDWHMRECDDMYISTEEQRENVLALAIINGWIEIFDKRLNSKNIDRVLSIINDRSKIPSASLTIINKINKK